MFISAVAEFIALSAILGLAWNFIFNYFYKKQNN